MRRGWRRVLIVAVVAALALAAGACDNDDDDDAQGGATSTSAPSVVDVFLIVGDGGPDCDTVEAVEREVPGDDPLAEAMTALLVGPTADEEGGDLGGWFSDETAGSLIGARVEGGVAFVDFEDFSGTIPNASSSCGSAGLLAQLDATARQFPSVERAVYSFDGDAEAFYAWLQMDVPEG